MTPAMRRILWGSPQPNYLLRDEFPDTAAAPLASPRTCLPGPGTLTLVQADGEISTAAGKMSGPAQATPVFGDQYVVSGTSFARAAGRAAIFKALSFGAANKDLWVGWNNDATPGASNVSGVDAVRTASAIAVCDNGTQFNLGDTYSASTDYDFAVIQRATGSFFLAKGGAWGSSWKLIWVGVAGSGVGWAALSNYDQAWSLGDIRVLDLGGVWLDPYGPHTEKYLGNGSAGQTFRHTANGIIEWTQTTLPSAGSTNIHFRRQDASNFWQVYTNATGEFTLRECVAGAFTLRATVAGVVANGHRCVLIFDGATIRGYSNNTLRWTYALASNFQTATVGEVNSFGTGGAIADLITYPRDVSPFIPANL